ncbi:MAG: acyl-protein synthetase [Hahellaceae bacterium]|nr:acyl-protein synthetase [Hahellaceae bacterium]MCP5211744.1 acyl-protein synthetase [Hahellaceae bacterium]
MHTLLGMPVYDSLQAQKEEVFLSLIKNLTNHHFDCCDRYRRVLKSQQLASPQEIQNIAHLDDVPFVSVNLFKHFTLKSVAESDVVKLLYSSGTTSQQKSRVYLDKDTAQLQSKVLMRIMQSFVGKQRLPMLIADMPLSEGNTTDDGYTARGAGIQGLAFLGHHHTYLLDRNMQLNLDGLRAFAATYGQQPVLLFGFTWVLWSKVILSLEEKQVSFSFPKGVLLHSGGWKKLRSVAVDNPTFNSHVINRLGTQKIHNFYGMAEQVGSVYVGCELGYLHCPSTADIIVRHVQTLQPAELGEPGIIQVLSLLPLSYPGHSLLTEDLGRIIGVDDCRCGRRGKYFEVLGRLPKSELRGCSDTL